MNEVASVAIRAVSILKETAASFSLVFRIGLVVLLEFMKSVSKFATFFVWTVPVLHEFFAKLRLLLVEGVHFLPRRFFS